MEKDVIGQLNSQLDFGIWDDEYLCVVEFDNNNKVSRIKISSMKEDIKKSKVWEKKILEKATRIYNIEKDPQNFIQAQK